MDGYNVGGICDGGSFYICRGVISVPECAETTDTIPITTTSPDTTDTNDTLPTETNITIETNNTTPKKGRSPPAAIDQILAGCHSLAKFDNKRLIKRGIDPAAFRALLHAQIKLAGAMRDMLSWEE
jgi:hypothetical protein